MEKCWAVDLEVPGSNPGWGKEQQEQEEQQQLKLSWSLADGRRQKVIES